MGGFFIRPRGTTKNDPNGLVHVEAIGVVQSYEDEYMETTGHNPSNVNSGAIHRRDRIRRAAAPGAPTPGGSWSSPVSKSTPSGFGKGTRAGKSR